MTESKQDRIQRVARIIAPSAFAESRRRTIRPRGPGTFTGALKYADREKNREAALSKASAIEAIYEGIGKDQGSSNASPSQPAATRHGSDDPLSLLRRRVAAPLEHELAEAIEPILFRRVLDGRLDGYTLEAAQEIANVIVEGLRA